MAPKREGRISSILRRARRWIAGRIEPKAPEPDPQWDIPIDLGLRGAAELRDRLHIDEEMYLTTAGQAVADARGYVIYTALDELEKTAMYLMRQREFLQGDPIKPRAGRLDRLMQAHIVEEHEARERRLLEVLLVLILFNETNDQKHFRHFLMLEELDELVSSNADLLDFYEAPSANIADSIEHQLEWIRKLETDLDLSTCWYRRFATPIHEQKSLGPGQVLSSARSRLKRALPTMTAHEKLLFGFSYRGGYGRTSATIHYRSSGDPFHRAEGLERRAIQSFAVLIPLILNRCNDLLGGPTTPKSIQVADMLRRSAPTEFVHDAVVRDIDVGDFVLAYGDLAEVLEEKASSFGYKAYRVRYLAEKPKPDIQEDWFPARYVQRFYTRTAFFKNLRAYVADGKVPKDVLESLERLPAEVISQILRASLTETWNRGLGEWVRQRRYGGRGPE